MLHLFIALRRELKMMFTLLAINNARMYVYVCVCVCVCTYRCVCVYSYMYVSLNILRDLNKNSISEDKISFKYLFQ